MNLQEFLLILKARRRTMIITLLVVVASTIAVSLVLPKTYKAGATLVLNYKGIDAVTGSSVPAQLMPGYMATQVDIVKSKNVALKVVDALKLADNPVVKQEFSSATNGQGDIRDWLADLLLEKLEVSPSLDSSVLKIDFAGADPGFAALVANTFASEYQKTTVQLKMEPLQKASSYFNAQIKVLRDNLEAAQARLSKYQQEKGIVSVDNRLDVETARLNELSTQLVLVQGQRMEAASKNRLAGGSDSPDVVANPLVQNLKASLAKAEAHLSDLAEKLGTNHPQYQGAKAEVVKLRAELGAHIQSTSNSVAHTARIIERREAEVRAALDAQRDKVLTLNRARDELSVLVKETESAQRAYDATMQRFNQTSIEGQSNQTDVAVLNTAVAPREASSPRLILNVLVSLFLGSFLGLGFALLAEILDRRIRSANLLADETGVPVLAVFGPSAKRDARSTLHRLLGGRKAQLQ